MKRVTNKQKGFTLIEVITVLVLVGMIGIGAVTYVIKVTEAQVFTRNNATTIQKGQVAMMQMVKVLTNASMSSITAADGYSISFTSPTKDQGTINFTITRPGNTGNTISINGITLTDQVSDFELKYYRTHDTGPVAWEPGMSVIVGIRMVLESNGVDCPFEARVKPRNL